MANEPTTPTPNLPESVVTDEMVQRGVDEIIKAKHTCWDRWTNHDAIRAVLEAAITVRAANARAEGLEADARRYRFWRQNYNNRFVLCLPGGTAKFNAGRPQVEILGPDYESKIDAAIDAAQAVRSEASEGDS